RAWRKVLALDPADHGGASVRLAALGHGATPERAPDAYVRTLFDQQAERFDEVLVERLGYRVPWVMRRMLERHAPGPYRRLLDLGCGTGLVGEAFSGLAEHVTGVDLSEGMLDRAFDRGVYDDLYVGDVLGFLATEDEEEAPPWDLVAAADMLPYLGPVAPLFAGVAALAAAGAVFLFSTEALAEPASVPYAVGPGQRFAHAPAHLRAALDDAGFALLAAEDIVVRYEEGVPVPGELVLARLT
ncbi:MAG TPA: methyltransferase, partial [Thermohalobaculum sp.]|nr:methyltransferase [Thermohalobaculum sp.]